LLLYIPPGLSLKTSVLRPQSASRRVYGTQNKEWLFYHTAFIVWFVHWKQSVSTVRSKVNV